MLHPISKYQFFFKHHSSGWFYNQNWISSSIKLMKQWSNQLNMYKKKFLCIFLCLSLSLFVTGWFNSHITQILYLNNRNICSLTISDPKQSSIHVCLNYLEFFHLYHRSTIYRKKISWSHSVYISTHSSELLGLVVTWSPTIKVSLKGFQPQVQLYFPLIWSQLVYFFHHIQSGQNWNTFVKCIDTIKEFLSIIFFHS